MLTIPNITFCIGMLSIIFTVYHYFKNPQIKGEKVDALFDQRMKFVQESNDRRFTEVHEEIKAVTATNQNHLHTVDKKMDALTKTVEQMGKDIVKLSTIIDERIPKKCDK